MIETYEILSENPFEKVLETLRHKFSSNDLIHLSITSVHRGMAYLRIQFTEMSGENSADKEMVSQVTSEIKNTLKEENMELGSISSAGNWSLEYVINQRVVDGKINWRRWLPYPDKFKEESQVLLDEVAGFLELQDTVDEFQGDSLGRFDKFVKLACNKGLIHPEEKRKIENQYGSVAN